MLISELTVYDFLKDKIKLSESDARSHMKQLLLEQEKTRGKYKRDIIEESKHLANSDKIDLKEMEARIERGFRELIIVIISLMLAFAAVGITIIKLF